MLLWRRFTVTRLIDTADGYVREQNERPLQIAIRAAGNLNYMETYGIVPDNFEDQAEQERLLLLIRKLIHIRDHCLSHLSENEKELAERGVKAFAILNLIERLSPSFDAYHNHFQYKEDLAGAVKRNQTMKFWRIAAVILPTTLLTLAVMVLSSIAHPATGKVILGSIIGEFVLVTAVYIITNRKIEHNITDLKAAIAQTAQLGRVNDEPFWQSIRAEFGSIPTHEEINRRWDEQYAFLDTIFPPVEDKDDEINF